MRVWGGTAGLTAAIILVIGRFLPHLYKRSLRECNCFIRDVHFYLPERNNPYMIGRVRQQCKVLNSVDFLTCILN